MKTARAVISLLSSLLILAGGAAVAVYFVWTAPKTEPEEKEQATRIVQTITVAPRTEEITVTAYGEVIPAREVVMRPQVSGRVIRQHESLVPGGILKAGEELLTIDPADYELALTEQEAALEEAKFEMEVERGRQVVASREWEELKKDLPEGEANEALVLREPHLKLAQAMVEKAENEIAKARLNLERTSLEVPFNAMVLAENVETGQLVESGNEICTLAGTDEFWVRATLPVSELRWIQLPGPEKPGAAASVHLDAGQAAHDDVPWKGQVSQLLSDLEESGRMARVVVSIPDPMAVTGRPGSADLESGTGRAGGHGGHRVPLLLGSYVRIEISAGELRDVLEIPRQALREGDRIWVVGDEKKLMIRDATVLWTRRNSVLIENILEPGEVLVVSELKAALPGLEVDPQPASGFGDDGDGDGDGGETEVEDVKRTEIETGTKPAGKVEGGVTS